MSWTMIARDGYEIVRSHILSLKEKNKFIVPVLVGLCVALAVAGLCYLYYSHMKSKEQMAHAVLIQCMEEYQRARQGQADWSSVEAMCKAGYEQYAATKTAVYFIPFRVDALLELDQNEAAQGLLSTMVSRLGTSSPLYHVYKTKLALVKLDREDAAQQVSGLKELQELADDTKNLQRDMALYYLALYQSSHNLADDAQETLKKLYEIKAANPLAESPWVSLAQEAFGAQVA